MLSLCISCSRTVTWDQALLDLRLETSPCVEEPQLQRALVVASGAALGRGQSPPHGRGCPSLPPGCAAGARSALQARGALPSDAAALGPARAAQPLPREEGKLRAARAPLFNPHRSCSQTCNIPRGRRAQEFSAQGTAGTTTLRHKKLCQSRQ